jgi:hypothetical protein
MSEALVRGRIYKGINPWAGAIVRFAPVPANNIFIFVNSDGSTFQEYFRDVCSFIYFGPALTNTEELAHYNRVQALQTALGRQV